MNPESQQTEQPFNLPEPQGDRPELLPAEHLGASSSAEIAASLAIEHGQSASDPGTNPIVPSVQPTPTTPANIGSLPQSSPLAIPLIADDGDLIEKEWVEKAKDIVGRTKHDPYMQNEEINRVKVDYLKKRYNKDIKLSEDS